MGKKSIICLIVTGFIFLAIGVVALFGFPPLFKSLLNKSSYLEPGSQVYDDWEDPSDYPLYMNFYFFDILNPDEILTGADPHVNQTGRLSYREILLKYDVNITEDGQHVHYYNNHTYVYDEENSEIAEDHEITAVNIVMWTVWNTAKAGMENLMLQQVIDGMYNGDDANATNYASAFYKVEAADLLWGVHPNLLLVHLNELLGGDKYPELFGLQTNGTADGFYQINTGKGNDNKERGEIESWNGSPHLRYWGTEQCNMVNGTDGTIFPTFMNEDERLYVFDTNMCRSIFLTKSESDPHQTLQGVDTTRFVAPEEVFMVDFEGNVCYCIHGTDDQYCVNGLLDVSQCQQENIFALTGTNLTGLNIVLSLPNFLYSNESEINVIGMNPDVEKHGTYLNIETQSGLVIEAAKRLQINTILNKKTNGLKFLKHFPKEPKKIVPIMWVEEYFPSDGGVADTVFDQVVKPARIVDITSYVLVGLGVVFLIVAVLMVIFADRIYARRHSTQDYSTLDNEQEGKRSSTIQEEPVAVRA